MSTSKSSNSLDRNLDPSLPSSTVSVAKTSSTNELNLLADNTNNQQSPLKTLIRYIMRAFYDVPKSLVVEYIYHYECISLEDLACLLCLNSEEIQSYIQDFKRNKFIIEEHHSELNECSNSRSDSNELHYKIDIPTFVNVVKYRLINMQSSIENFERQELCEQINYKCERCLNEYTELDIGKLHANNTEEEDLICIRCRGIVNENNQAEQQPMRLFNEQMTPLFDILKRIDEIMKNEHSTTDNLDSEVTIQKDDDTDRKLEKSKDEIMVKPLRAEEKTSTEPKPLPEWFARSTVIVERDQTN